MAFRDELGSCCGFMQVVLENGCCTDEVSVHLFEARPGDPAVPQGKAFATISSEELGLPAAGEASCAHPEPTVFSSSLLKAQTYLVNLLCFSVESEVHQCLLVAVSGINHDFGGDGIIFYMNGQSLDALAFRVVSHCKSS